jgi:acyl-CoA thioesterase I
MRFPAYRQCSWGCFDRFFPIPATLYYVDVRRLVPAALFLPIFWVATPYAAEPPNIDRPILVCYGDSITAGHGLAYGEAYPDFLEKKLDAQGYRYKVINQGTSGATTKDALAGLPFVLRMHPAVVIVEFGGNDGLRGVPVAESRSNLDQVLTALEKAHVKILLAGITLPPDYGPDYIRSFNQMFRDLAARHHVAFVPMLYQNLVHVPGTIQDDGIHPTAKGSAIIADTLLPVLKPLLRKGP